mmetsp:Transcript_25089/g.63185  ORF Transcript_25089/g.63185 Transcript_25089/m.63185 type:complete len:399 (-) Transcript_25089:2871-4067(-)
MLLRRIGVGGGRAGAAGGGALLSAAMPPVPSGRRSSAMGSVLSAEESVFWRFRRSAAQTNSARSAIASTPARATRVGAHQESNSRLEGGGSDGSSGGPGGTTGSGSPVSSRPPTPGLFGIGGDGGAGEGGVAPPLGMTGGADVLVVGDSRAGGGGNGGGGGGDGATSSASEEVSIWAAPYKSTNDRDTSGAVASCSSANSPSASCSGEGPFRVAATARNSTMVSTTTLPALMPVTVTAAPGGTLLDTSLMYLSMNRCLYAGSSNREISRSANVWLKETADGRGGCAVLGCAAGSIPEGDGAVGGGVPPDPPGRGMGVSLTTGAAVVGGSGLEVVAGGSAGVAVGDACGVAVAGGMVGLALSLGVAVGSSGLVEGSAVTVAVGVEVAVAVGCAVDFGGG